MKLLEIVKSNRQGKKWKAVFQVGDRTKTTHFGAEGMEDYTQHHDKERRQRYRERHEKDLRTDDPTRAGFLSYYILWGNSINMDTNIREYKRKFNL